MHFFSSLEFSLWLVSLCLLPVAVFYPCYFFVFCRLFNRICFFRRLFLGFLIIRCVMCIRPEVIFFCIFFSRNWIILVRQFLFLIFIRCTLIPFLRCRFFAWLFSGCLNRLINRYCMLFFFSAVSGFLSKFREGSSVFSSFPSSTHLKSSAWMISSSYWE